MRCSSRPTSRAMPMRTLLPMFAVFRTAVPAKANHRHTGRLHPTAGRSPTQPQGAPALSPSPSVWRSGDSKDGYASS